MPTIVRIEYGPEPVEQVVVESPTWRHTVTVDGEWRVLVVASGGGVFRMTKADILALYAQQTGSAQLRRARTVQAVLARAAAYLGDVDFALDLDLDGGTGQLTRLTPKPKGA